MRCAFLVMHLLTSNRGARMLVFLLFFSFQGGPTFPPRDYQPGLSEPGLHGGRINKQTESNNDIFDGPADLTPDGRVLVSFRKLEYQPGTLRWALVASTVDPDRIQSNANGRL